MDEASVDGLDDVDWSFSNADTDQLSSGIHPYHARFIPQIPGKLLDIYTERGDRVLDPFVGSGTTDITHK